MEHHSSEVLLGEGLTQRARRLLVGLLLLGVGLELGARLLDDASDSFTIEWMSLLGLFSICVSVVWIVQRASARPLSVGCMIVASISVITGQICRMLAMVQTADGSPILDNSTRFYTVTINLLDMMAPALLAMGFFLLTFQLNQVRRRHASQAEQLQREAHVRLEIEQALRESEAALNEAQSIARLGNWHLDIATEQVTGSSEFYRIFHLEPQPFDLHAFLNSAESESKMDVGDHLRTAIQTGVSWDIEHRLKLKDHPLQYVHSRGRAVKDATGKVVALIGIIQDISDRKHAQEQAMRFNKALDGSLNELFIFDAETLKFLEVNRGARKNLGYTKKEFTHLNALDLLPDMSLLELLDLLRPLIKGDVAVLEYTTRQQRKDGSTYPIEARVQLFQEDAPVVLVIATDISERVRGDEERKAFEHQLQQAQRLESLGVMAGGIAHDFNNILTIILGNAELAIGDMPADSKRMKNLKAIVTAAQRAAGLTDQMLTYSGKGNLSIEKLNLTELVREMAHLLEVSHIKKALVHYDFDENIPAIEGDAAQLRQVVMNLITNASEAIGDKGGDITIKTGLMFADSAFLAATYTSDTLHPGDYVYLEVSDTGEGMDDEAMRQVFDPFFTTKFLGRGLGMAAVLGIVRAHLGAIELRSTVGEGTTVRVLIPALTDVVRLQPVVEHPVLDIPAEGSILIVDDEDRVMSLIQRVVEDAGFTALTAEDGPHAIELMKTHGDDIVCVLLDLTMPHMSGEETFVELRKLREEVPVLLISGYSEEQLQEQAHEVGFSGFLKKPVSPRTLMSKIRTVI